jgi:DNA-binding response OmpR family regulator
MFINRLTANAGNYCVFVILLEPQYMKRHRSSLRFLIIEDVKEHEALIKEAVHTHDFLHDISSVKNCSMALDLLKEYKSDDYLPHVIILDLNVGGMNARDFLVQFNATSEFSSIPVIALTNTIHEPDRDFVNGFKNCVYVVKPAGILEFMELINFICNFWSEHKKVPDYQSIRRRIS